MREIKFRGKRVDNGEWMYGTYYKHVNRTPCPIGDDMVTENDYRYLIIRGGFSDWNMPRSLEGIEVIPETVGQYTGLKDKNGKEIYEGDIIESEYNLKDYNYIVEWVYSGFQIVTYKKQESDVRGISDGMNQGYFEDSEGCEVIGNIYEN